MAKIQNVMATSVQLDTMQASNSLKSLNTAIKSTTAAWRAESAQLRSAGDNLKAAETKYNGLGRSIDALKDKINYLKDEQSKLDTSTAQGRDSYNKYNTQLANATRQLASLTSQQERAKSSLDYYKTGLSGLQSSYRTINQVSESYVNRLEAEGRSEEANQQKMMRYRASVENLSKQYKLQTQELERIASESGRTSEAYQRQEVRVNQTATSLAKAKNEMHDLSSSMSGYQTHLNGLKGSYETVNRVSTSYVNRLKAEGKTQEANERQMSSYRSAIENLTKQYKLQSEELQRIASESGKSSEAYKKQEVAVNETATSLAKTKTKMNGLAESMRKANPSIFDKIKNKLTGVNDEAKHSHSLFKTIFSADVISNAFTNGLSNVWQGFKNMVSSGMQLDEQVEKINDQFKALGKSKSDIKGLDNEVNFLKTHTHATGSEVAQLLQTTNRMAAGNTEKAMKLARGIGAIGDGAKASGRQMNTLAQGMSRVVASGKVSAQTFNRMAKAAPNLGHALANAAGVSEQKFNQMVQSGKMSSADFMRYVEKAGQNGSKTFRDFTKTQQGATWYMSQSWDALKAKLTKPLFNAKTSGLTELADLMNSKPVQQGTQMLAEGLRQVAKYALEGLGWMAKHKKDIVGISSDFVVIVKDMAIDVWKDFAAILTDLAKHFGLVSRNTKATKDPLHDFRKTMDAIAKNPKAIKKIADALVIIAGLKTLGAVVSPIAKIATFSVPENSVIAKLFKMSKNTKMFQGLATSAKSAASKMSGSFSKVWSGLTSSAKSTASKLPGMFTGAWQKVRQGLTDALSGKSAGGAFQSLRSASKTGGLSTSGKVMNGLAAAGVGIDVATQISHAIKDSPGSKKQYQDAGKGVGSAIGGAIGMWFGGAPGAAMGSQIGKVIGGWGGKEAHAFMQGWNAHVPPANKFSLPNLAYSMHQMFTRLSKGFSAGWKSFRKGVLGPINSLNKSIDRTVRSHMSSFGKWYDSFLKNVLHIHIKGESSLEKEYNKHIKRQEKAAKKHFKASTKAHANMYGTEEKDQSKHDKKSEKEHSRHIKAIEKADANHRKKHSKNKSKEYKSREKAQSNHYKKSEKAKKNHIARQEKQDANHRKKHSKNRSTGYKKREKEQSNHYKKLERAKKKHITKNERSDSSHRKKHSRNTSKAYKSLERAESAHYKRSAKQRTSYAKTMAKIEAKYDKQSPKQWKKQWRQMEKIFQSGAKKVEKIYQKFFKELDNQNKRSLKDSTKAWNNYWKSADKANEKDGRRLVKIIQTYTRRAEQAWRSYWRTVEKGQDEFNDAMEHRRSSWLAKYEHDTNDRLVAMEHDWRAYWKTVDRVDSEGWRTLLKHEASWSKTMNNRLSTFSRNWQKGFKSLGNGVNRIWSQAFTKLRHTTVNGLNGMIGELNRGIDRINSVISAYGGHSRIGHAGKVGYATGTGYMAGMRRPITKPTLAIVNDGNDSPETGNKEAIIRGNSFGIFQGRNVPALLMPGDEILNATETKQLMHASGIDHYASGTGILGILDWSKSSDSGLKKYYDKAEDIIKHAAQYLSKIFTYSAGALSGAIRQISSGMFSKSKNQASDFWQTMWSMASDELDGDGDASGLLGAVEKYGHGKPYVWGAAGPSAFDCSGLVMYALQKAFHKSFPHYSGAQFNMTVPVSDPQPGDLVFFGPGGSEHVGVYAGGGKYYSAHSPALGIGMSAVGSGAIYRRIPGLKPANASSTGPKADSAIKKFVKAAVGSGFWKFMEKLGDKFGFGAMDNPTGTGVARWVEVIKAAADKMHVDLSGHDIALIENVIQHESRGEAGAQNNWDSNAIAGHPSKGLLQYVQSTFDTYAMPGHHNIWSGYDQLLALFNDSTWRTDLHWGGGWGPNGRRRFYADGGIVNSMVNATLGEDGIPETIIPWDITKRARAYQLMDRTLKAFGKQDNPDGKSSAQGSLTAEAVSEIIKLLMQIYLGITDLTNTPIDLHNDIKIGNRTIEKISQLVRRDTRDAMIRKKLGISGLR